MILFWVLQKRIIHSYLNSFFKNSLALIIFLALLEVVLNLYYYSQKHNWYFLSPEHPNKNLFEPHPYLGLTNKALADETNKGIRIQHNSKGQRGKEYSSEDLSTATRIATIGGSTTYGVGVNNNEIWPALLDSILGEDSMIINLSVPGHSSVEHLITASLYLEECKPEIIVIHSGLNDMKNSHVKDLKNDYSNFHEPYLFGVMGQCYLEEIPKISSLYYTVRFLQKMNLYPICDFHKAKFHGHKSDEIDSNVLGIYTTNLKKLIYICKYYTDNIIIVPQVLLEEKVKDDGLLWWIPYVPEDQLVNHMNAFNKASRETAVSMNCSYLESVENHHWTQEDFTDPSHFNAQANKKLAIMIHECIKEMNLPDTTQ